MSLDSELEELLQAKKDMEDRIEQQEQQLSMLDAHKRTLVKALVTQRVATDFPVPIEYTKDSRIVEIADTYPFYIFNIGRVVLLGPGGGCPLMPLHYKVLRKFAKTGLCKTASDTVFYTTTVLSKNGRYVFLIKDDENNTWRGPDAFREFSSSFPDPIPFKNIVEWLGLNCKPVQEMIRRSMSCQELSGMYGGTGKLDAYFPKDI